MEISGVNAFTVRSPGRINLIGEHTDYNQGYVLPAAINRYITVTASKRDDNNIVCYAQEFKERLEIPITEIWPRPSHWSNYVLGVVCELLKEDHPITGFNLVLKGDVPLGAGMSSSAAVECAVVYALNTLFDLRLTRIKMALIAQQAEHNYAGVKCGIMDQYASLFGKANTAVKLDCRSLTHEYVPLNLEDYQIVLFNTNVRHQLAATEYNRRRAECEEGVKQIKRLVAEVSSLRDVTPSMLDYIKDPLVRKRCGYVVRENQRLLEGCEDLKSGDLKSFGKKLFASHKGLRDDYEVSCPELDWLVDAVKKKEGVIGARMMGGGFGGCTINLIRSDRIEHIENELSEGYEKAMGRPLSMYVAETADGTAPVTQKILV